jgi:hypothetical protein
MKSLGGKGCWRESGCTHWRLRSNRTFFRTSRDLCQSTTDRTDEDLDCKDNGGDSWNLGYRDQRDQPRVWE